MKTSTNALSCVATGLLLLAGSQRAAAINTLDLTSGTTSGTINGAYFILSTEVTSTGTGNIDSFVRLSAPTGGGHDGTLEGYNASDRPVMPEVNTSPQFTRDLQLFELPLFLNPVGLTGYYYEFLLDSNQDNRDPLLSLDTFQLWTSPTTHDPANSYSQLQMNATLRFDIDAAPDGPSEVLLNDELAGSGKGDLYVYIPQSVFAGLSANTYVYLFSQFGYKGGAYVDNGGFEEWAIRTGIDAPPQQVPDGGATVMLMGLGTLAIGFFRNRQSK